MTIGILGFDHPIIAVRDLEQSRRQYQRLGFMVPPAGRHLEWGTGNWCIMFPNTYLEHRGITDPTRYTHGLEHFLEVREGLMGMAFRSNLDNHELYRNALEAGLHPAEPRELTRNFELASGAIPVSFRLVFFDPTEAPSLMASLVCEHLTPERLRRPEFLVHPNGAQEVSEMVSVVESLEGVREQLLPYFGPKGLSQSYEEIEVRLPDGGVQRIITQALAARRGLALEGVALPYLASTTVRVESLRNTYHWLVSQGVPFEDLGARIRVSPHYSCGLYLEFSEL